MLHQDASRHVWLAGLGPLDLVATLDDATSTLNSLILVPEEGTMSSFRGLAEVIAAKGLCCSLYTDRGSHYFYTPEAGGKVAKDVPTQVGRALSQLGIEHIAAYSPQARGRSERMFRTLRDRLVKRFIREVYLPQHNARFAIKPAATGSAFVAVAESQWRDVLCVQEERTVAPDNTVSWNGRRLQIPPHPARAHFVRAKVRVHEYPDGAMAIFHGPRCLVRWEAPTAHDASAAVQAWQRLHDASAASVSATPASRGRTGRLKGASRRLRRSPSATLTRPALPRGADAWPGRRNSRCDRPKEHGLDWGLAAYAAFGPSLCVSHSGKSGRVAPFTGLLPFIVGICARPDSAYCRNTRNPERHDLWLTARGSST